MPAQVANSKSAARPEPPPLAALASDKAGAMAPARLLAYAMLFVAAILYALHWKHLNADFPNLSPWVDWSKYTDEGWYGDAATRQLLFGHWYFAGDFNPAVALPVWPALEYLGFRIAGVSIATARGLTLCIFAATLFTVYVLLRRHARADAAEAQASLAAPLAVLLLCASPFFYVFSRMAILEPLLIALTVLALLAASCMILPTAGGGLHRLLPGIWLTLLLPAMVLTKTTGVCLFPAIFYMVWAGVGYRLRPFLRLALPPAAGALAIWSAYFFLLVRPHYLEDYRYLFSANAYTGFELEPLYRVVLHTVSAGSWMGTPLYIGFFLILCLVLFWRVRLLGNPLFVSLLLWIGGYFVFLAYHNNLQPRYYLVVAAPITMVVAMGIDSCRLAFLQSRRVVRIAAAALASAAALAIVVSDTLQQATYVLHPTFDFFRAAQSIKQTVLADKDHPHLLLSISGSDITLMTGLPSIDDDFGTLSLDSRVQQYRPGWYAAWNELDDDKADAISPLYQPVRVAAYPAYDDPDRNLLILYRLDPLTEPPAGAHPARRHRIPKPLVTKLGQQPSNTQLVH